MTPDQLLDLIDTLTTISPQRKEEIFAALADGTFDEAMNEELIAAVEKQEALWTEEMAQLQAEYETKSQELSTYLTQVDTEHKAALREAYQTVKKNIADAEKEAEDTAKTIMAGADVSEADTIRKQLGIA